MHDLDKQPDAPSGSPPPVSPDGPAPHLLRMTTDVRSLSLSVLTVMGTVLMLQYAQAVLIPIVLGVLINQHIGSFMRVQVFTSVVVAIATGFALWSPGGLFRMRTYFLIS